MDFEYFYMTQAAGSLSIEDPGNCAIKAFADNGTEYIFASRTSLGSTMLFNFGPIVRDSEVLPKSVNCSFKRIDYSESQINTAIKKFLNNPYANITQAYEADYKEALDDCIDIAEYMKKENSF